MQKNKIELKQVIIRHDWQIDEVMSLFEQPFSDLIFQAQWTHRHYFDPNRVQLSTLLNIKTGQCPEDCAYCPQSAHFKTDLKSTALMEVDKIIAAAQKAKDNGATRFCMGTAGRVPDQRDFETVLHIIKSIKNLGLETCVTLGMLTQTQAEQLKAAGLDYYNHNLDTSAEFYGNIITTRTYQDRLDTLRYIFDSEIKVCCGGIIGMGESVEDRANLLITLANLQKHPDSVPINQLVRVAGTPLEDVEKIDNFEIVRCIAVARILMPVSYVRLSAGRADMNDELQTLCFLAGANSIFYGEKLLTTDNAAPDHDRNLLKRLGMNAEF